MTWKHDTFIPSLVYVRTSRSNTLYEGLLKGVGDADEVSSLVDAIGSGLGPRSHWQVVK